MIQNICVFCGSSESVHTDYKTAAFDLGRVLALQGIRLVYGGGRTGLMGAIADGALHEGGVVIGVTVRSMSSPALIHAEIGYMETAQTMHERKARMYELSDGFIALPGGYGTLDELFEVITWGQIGEHEKPVGVLDVNNYYQPLLLALDGMTAQGFILNEHRNSLLVDTDPSRLLLAMSEYQHSSTAVDKWLLR